MFVGGRGLTINIIDMDSFSRLSGMTAGSSEIPGLFLIDALAAFPSADRNYLHGSVSVAGADPSFSRALTGLYAGKTMRWPLLPHLDFCEATSGVAQGCPLSGFLFVIAADSFVRAIHTTITGAGAGVVRFCADDGAISM